MRAVALIPARGGSKRIPGKNTRLFCGRPIISYSIEAARTSGLFDAVYVSTDAEPIREQALRDGAEVPFLRDARTADDHATLTDVVADFVEKDVGRGVDVLCLLLATAPFVTSQVLGDAWKELEHSGADGLVSVAEFPFPAQRAFVVERGVLKLREPEYEMVRSNDLPPTYHDAGQFYFVGLESFRVQKRIFMNRMMPFVLPRERVADIDTECDWAYAEKLFQVVTSGE